MRVLSTLSAVLIGASLSLTPATSLAAGSKASHKSSRSGKSAKSKKNSKSKRASRSKKDREPSSEIADTSSESTLGKTLTSADDSFVGPRLAPSIDLPAIAGFINSNSTMGELISNLAGSGFASGEERVAIERFLKDRGVRMESPLQKVKAGTNSLRLSEITLTLQPDGSLKNSFGQNLNSEGKSLDTAFGEAYLSFDRRSSRARAMDLFLQEAQADTGATPAARGWGAITAAIYNGLRAGKTVLKPASR